jgi:hypothetical protein
MERRRSARDRSRGPKAKPPPEQLPGKWKKKPAAKKITTNVNDNSPLDATNDDGGKPVDSTGNVVDEDATGNDNGKYVDATGNDVDEPLDATGDDGDKQVDATGNGVDEQVDATGDDGCKHVDATGNDVLDEPLEDATRDDGDEQVDATGDEGDNDNVSNDGNNRFVCTIVNHPGPCG